MAAGRGFGQHVVMTDIIHDRIHQGSMFTCNWYSLNLGNNNDVICRISVPSGSAHARATITCTGQARVVFRSGDTFSADGTAKTVGNRNGFSTLTATTLVYEDPTVDVAGTVVGEFIIPGGEKKQATGGIQSGYEEQVLPPGEYTLIVTNTSGQDADVGFQIDFYEPPEGRVPVLS